MLRIVFKNLDEQAAGLLIESAAGEDRIVNIFEFFELLDAILIYQKCIIAQKIYKCDLWTKFRLICNILLN